MYKTMRGGKEEENGGGCSDSVYACMHEKAGWGGEKRWTPGTI